MLAEVFIRRCDLQESVVLGELEHQELAVLRLGMVELETRDSFHDDAGDLISDERHLNRA